MKLKLFPACSIGVIGGADGPTAIFVTSKLSLAAIAAGVAIAVVCIIIVIAGVCRKKRR